MKAALDEDDRELKSWRRLIEIRRAFALLFVTIISGLIGQMYGEMFYADALEDSIDAYRGFRTGAMIGFVSAAIEIYYIRSSRRNWVRRAPFFKGLIVRILVITAIIRLLLIFNTAITNSLVGAPLFSDMTAGDEFRDTMLSLAIVVFFVVASQLSTILGPKRFINLVAGRYFRPQAEQRIFVFVDLVGSTQMALKFGDVKFHEFLSEFFYVIDNAILRYGAEIVSYVGDAVILTFPLVEDRRANGQVLAGIRAMHFAVSQHKQDFERDFGMVPVFRAAAHGGPVVVGECGNSRRQVTFLGDTVNVTARIESVAKSLDEPILVSSELAARMEPPRGIALESLGEVSVRGIEAPVALHRIRFVSSSAATPSKPDRVLEETLSDPVS
ncbi:MAG: adenylate/guanylate cyclase domain-containing protein [Pseudomonadota bacterium]